MKGTAAHGQHGTSKSHIVCRRCGRRSYHPTKAACASCGYGKSSKRRNRHVGH